MLLRTCVFSLYPRMRVLWLEAHRPAPAARRSLASLGMTMGAGWRKGRSPCGAEPWGCTRETACTKAHPVHSVATRAPNRASCMRFAGCPLAARANPHARRPIPCSRWRILQQIALRACVLKRAQARASAAEAPCKRAQAQASATEAPYKRASGQVSDFSRHSITVKL